MIVKIYIKNSIIKKNHQRKLLTSWKVCLIFLKQNNFIKITFCSYKNNAIRLQKAIQQAGKVKQAADIIEQVLSNNKLVWIIQIESLVYSIAAPISQPISFLP